MACSQTKRSDEPRTQRSTYLASSMMGLHENHGGELYQHQCLIVCETDAKVRNMGSTSAPFHARKGIEKHSTNTRGSRVYYCRAGGRGRVGTYQEVGAAYAKGQMTHGALIYGSFVTWQREKTRFIINSKEQSTHWDKRSVKMKTLSSYGTCLCPGDRLLSFDWSSGYMHFALHRRMWNWFLFKYNQRYYRSIALPFRWTSSPYWFVKILSPLTRYMRSELSLRVMVWIDYS